MDSRCSILGRGDNGISSRRHRIQTDAGAPASLLPNWHESSYLNGKAAGAWSWPLNSFQCWG